MAKNKAIEDRLMKARVRLVLDHPFFGMLALQQLELVESECVPTAGTDGKKLYYNPKTVEKWTAPEMTGVTCHEVLHAAGGHLWRREGRDPYRWNIACDFAINPIVIEAGLQLPAGALIDKEYEGKCAEEIYRLLPEDLNKKGIANQYTLHGDMIEPTSGSGNAAERAALEADWKAAVQAAAQAAKMQGKLPAGLERMVGEWLRPKCDWKSLLARFVQNVTKQDYTWARLNRRYLGAGFALPSLYTEACAPLAVAIDTSGSIGNEELQRFGSELNAICQEAKPERVYVLWADAEVAGVQVFEQGEPLILEPKGGGGTDFRPVFQWVEQNGEECACVIYLTDMCGTFPEQAPAKPTLWVATTSQLPPFGECIRLEDD